jgi:hypothetical protein
MNHETIRGELEATLKNIQTDMKKMRDLKRSYDAESAILSASHLQTLLKSCQAAFPDCRCKVIDHEIFICPTDRKVWFKGVKASYAERIQSEFGHPIKFTRTLQFNGAGHFRKFYIGLTAGYLKNVVKIKTIAPIFTRLKSAANV